MGKRLFIGNKAGVGPVVKVMADETYDPLTTSNTDYHKFLFNSEIQEIAYAKGKVNVTFDASAFYGLAQPPGAGQAQIAYLPSGSNATNCEVMVALGFTTSVYSYEQGAYVSGRETHIYYALDRLDGLSYRSILLRVSDNTNWRSIWKCKRFNYPNSTDGRYISSGTNDFPTLTRNAYWPNRPNWYNTDLGRTSRFEGWQSSHMTHGGIGGTFYAFAWNYKLQTTELYTTIAASDVDASDYVEDSLVITELPIENDSYPAVVGSFAANKKILKISSSTVKLAKPGYDVDTATPEQLILDSDRIPMKVAKTGAFTIAAGATTTVTVAFPITTKCIIDYQVKETSDSTLLLPPYPANNIEEFLLEHRVVGQTVEFRNQSAVSLDVRYIVLADEIETPSSGSAKVLEKTGGEFIIRRPNSAGAKGKDIILDSRAGALPLVAQGWVPKAAITTGSDVSRYGTHVYSVALTNPSGSWKPYVMARAKYEINGASGRYIYQDFFAKNIEISSYFSSSSFVAKVSDTEVRFYMDRDSTRAEDNYRIGSYYTTSSMMTFVGFRYYIFAIPNSL